MLDHIQPLLAENVIHVHQLEMASIGHSVIADEYDIHDVSEVSSFEGDLQIFGKSVDLTQNFLYGILED